MANGLAAFAVGLGSGYLTAQQRGRDQERQNRLDAQNADLHGARMDELNQAKSLRMGLADAVAPREVNAGVVLDGGQTKEFYQDPAQVTPQMQEDRRIESEMRAEAPGAKPMGLATGQVTPGYGTTGRMGLGNQITTEKQDATTLNSPAAQAQRIGLAYGAAGKPLEAMQYQKSVDDIEQAKKDRFAKLQAEGATRTARAMVSGDTTEVFRTFNAQGKSKLKAEPTVTTEDVDIPGVGKVKNHIYSGTIIDENGQEKPFTMSSHDANMALMPYKDMMTMQSNGLKVVNDNNYKTGMLGAAQTSAEAAKTRAERPGNSAASGQPSREERLRYTSLFQDAGRRAGEVQKAIGALQKDPLFSMAAKNNPNGPEATELKGMKDSLKQYNEERTLYQSMLAQSQSSGATTESAPAGLSGALPSATKVTPGIQQARDSDRATILNAELKRATEQGNQADIDALTREIGRLKPGLSNIRPTDSKPETATTASGRPPLSSFNR